jgi:hypothetical protein
MRKSALAKFDRGQQSKAAGCAGDKGNLLRHANGVTGSPRKKNGTLRINWWQNGTRQTVHSHPKSVPRRSYMLATRYRLNRNPYFHFHPLHAIFSLVGSLILFGLLVWFLAVPAR